MNKEWQHLNINTLVRVTRTPRVDRLVQLEYDKFWERCNPKYLEDNPVPYSLAQDTEVLEMPLWTFAATFGSYFYNGSTTPEELVNIQICM